MKGRIVKLGGIAMATAISFATLVTLVQADTAAITERREAMKSNGAAMKAINGIIEANGPAADIGAQAAKIHEVSLKVPDLFPAGSDQPQGKDPGQTMALPAIWADPTDFAAKVKALQDESAMLVTAAAGGDMAAIKAQYEKLGGACGACHKIYKAK